MTRKERIRTTLEHREPDRVPMFELTVANPVLESVLGRHIEGFGTGEAKAAGIMAGMQGAEARRSLIRRNVEGMMEFFEKVGYEMFWYRPTDFLVTFAMGLPDDITANSIFDVSITEVQPNIFRIESLEYGFWSVEQYEPESDICVTITDSISRGESPNFASM